jgi:undecaprenyl diphosphate synthase
MDGNGRYAQERGLPRLEGHRAGAQTVRDIVTYSRELGIRYLTLYAFSTENWGRPGDEVEGLMGLLYEYLVDERPTLIKNGIELHTIGDVARLPSLVRDMLDEVKDATRGLGGMRLTLALSYGGRDEIVRAVQGLVRDVQAGVVDVDSGITADAIGARLDTRGMPDPDLMIRTSGELRLSNFMLWQLAYAELYVTEIPWPAFSRAQLDKALASFAARQRRYGLTGAQVSDEAEPGARTQENA